MKNNFPLLGIIAIFTSMMTWATSPLAPVKTDHPRDTMVTFMAAMNDYKKGIDENNSQKQARIWDAVRTLNLADTPQVTRKESGRKVAILLKETIDRVIVIQPNFIPDNNQQKRWRLKDTEITISEVETGNQKGEFLFSPTTVDRAEEFYHRVKHLPYLQDSGKGANFKASWDKEYFPEWARREIMGIRFWQIVGLFCAILLGLIIKMIAESLVKMVKSLVTEKETSVKYRSIVAVEKPIGLLTASIWGLFSIYYLRFEGHSLAILTTFIQALLGMSLVWAAYRFVDVISLSASRWAKQSDNDLDDHLVPMITRAVRIFVVIFGVLLVIQNLGFNVMSLVAGLGLGGLAFALAAKDTAANLFGSIMIIIDRPFRVGDWIKNSDVEGTVEQIGFRSTRIRTFYNSLISIPNSILATTNIDNMGLRQYRRVKAYLGVTYDTPPEKLEAFIEGIKNIIEANEHTRKDYYHVVFNSYGNSSLNILLYCFLKVPDWSDELVQKQNLYLEILRLAEALKIDFAFPTTTLHMETFPEKQPSIIRHQDWTEEKIQKTAGEFAKNGTQSKPNGLGLFKRPKPDEQTFFPGDDD